MFQSTLNHDIIMLGAVSPHKKLMGAKRLHKWFTLQVVYILCHINHLLNMYVMIFFLVVIFHV
jgi:hypothetical protein